MKLSSQEEYGLRCLLRIASEGPGLTLTIPRISEAEGLSVAYVGKLMRILRQGGLVESTRGQSGGYALARAPDEIVVAEVLDVLGGRLVEPGFCEQFPGLNDVCTRSVDCSMRALWNAVQGALDGLLGKITLGDLARSEDGMTRWIARATPGK